MSKSAQTIGFERRREDYQPVTGRAHYVDDLRPAPGRPPVLYMAVVRSPYAHARITAIQLDAARSLPGVVAALAGAELVRGMPTLGAMPLPGLKKPERRPLAVDRVRYVGDPVAVILAESLYVAEDARDLVEVDYEPLPAVTDVEAAIEPGAPLLYDELGSNIALSQQTTWGDVQTAFAQADHVVSLRLLNQRLAPSSLEPRACMFDFDASTGELCAWLSSQSVFRARDTLATFLNLDHKQIRVHNADVGGAFGAKTVFLGEEIIAATLAMRYSRPVKWIEQRNENLQAQSQGRGQVNYIEAAFQHDGKLLALKSRLLGDLGAFLIFASPMLPTRTPLMLCGPYQVQAIESQVQGVLTNKAVTAPYRGAGRPEATYIVERVMDRIAHELQMDPAEVRRRNFIPPQAFPYKTVTGIVYDSGNYPAALERALQLAEYATWREKQRASRTSDGSRLIGIGLASFIELSGDSAPLPPGAPREAATVRIQRDGTALVQSGVAHNGQGHFTIFAQIVADVLGLPANKVEVRMNESDLPAYSIGTYGSRVTQVAGSAIMLAAQAVRDKAIHLTAQLLEASPADLVLTDGRIIVRGAPSRTMELGELARLVEEQPQLSEQQPPDPVNGVPIEGLAAWHDFSPDGAAYSSGTHIAIVEVDTETGEVRILKYVAVDDCGRVLNHDLAEAQIHGSLAQGIGQALYEEVVYDQEGQLLSGTLMDYALPLAHMVPNFVTDFIETPSPFNPLGAKGVGESGCIAAPPAVVNAVLDALAPRGITAIDMPVTADKVWSLLQASKATR
jgi:carbon-monoxide dehydrogenase large subunit